MGEWLEFGMIANKAKQSKRSRRAYKHMARTDGGMYERRSYRSSGSGRKRYSTKAKVAAFFGIWGLF